MIFFLFFVLCFLNTFSLNNVSGDEEEEVDESETDTEEQTNGTRHNIQDLPIEKKTSSNLSHSS